MALINADLCVNYNTMFYDKKDKQVYFLSFLKDVAM
jgi:hypothetical protein